MASLTVFTPVASCSGSIAAGTAQSGQRAALVSPPACILHARRRAFGDSKALIKMATRTPQRRGSFVVKAYDDEEEEEEKDTYVPYWPDKKFIQEVTDAFPDKGVATVDEARVLFSELGYTYLDVRPKIEVEEVGKVIDSVNIPIKVAKKKYNAETRKLTVEKTDNPDFLKQIQKKFPDPATAKILVGCSNGRAYSRDALIALDDAGYETIVGLAGGYYAWFKIFDNKLRRRMKGEYAEDYMHGADSAGIHASGAGFARSDKIEEWVPPEY